MTEVLLRNGQTEPEIVVTTTYLAMNSLWKNGVGGMLAVYDLREICEGRGKKVGQKSLEQLQALRLVESDGSVHASVKNVVLSSLQGQGLKTLFVSPVAEQKVEATQQAKEMPLEKGSLTDYYKRVFAIGEAMLDSVARNGFEILNEPFLYTNSVNPFYSRIPNNGGLIVEYSYGLPEAFCTPLGKVDLTGSLSYDGTASREKCHQELVERFGLVEIVPLKETSMGPIGPFYAVTKDVEEKPFPMVDGKTRLINTDYPDEYEKITALWEEVKPVGMAGRYDPTRGVKSIMNKALKKIPAHDKK